jgi:hypothetical protein
VILPWILIRGISLINGERFGFHAGGMDACLSEHTRIWLFRDNVMANGGTVTQWDPVLQTMGTHHVSDGLYHYYEIHMKVSTGGQANGIVEMWIDGRKVLSNTSVDFNGETGIYLIQPLGNHGNSDNGFIPVFNDIDDIAISTTDYIGPINGKRDTVAPAPPTGLAVN